MLGWAFRNLLPTTRTLQTTGDQKFDEFVTATSQGRGTQLATKRNVPSSAPIDKLGTLPDPLALVGDDDGDEACSPPLNSRPDSSLARRGRPEMAEETKCIDYMCTGSKNLFFFICPPSPTAPNPIRTISELSWLRGRLVAAVCVSTDRVL